MKPLAGRKVLITRARAQAGSLARELRSRGARVLVAPVIKFVPPKSLKPLDRALKRLGEYDVLVFTSANGVDRFFERAKIVLAGRPARPKRLFAVGPGTSRRLVKHGWKQARAPKVHEGEALALSLGKVRGLRILIPRASKARDILPQTLRRRGARVSVVPVYRTVADREGIRTLRKVSANGGVDWVTFTSASTVEHLLTALGPVRSRKLFAQARAGSIGPITSAALRRRGIAPVVEAAKFTVPGLVSAIAAHSRLDSRSALRRTLTQALREAGGIMLRRFGKVSLRYKGKANIVTAADLACERRILDIIAARFPDHDYITEESKPRTGGSDYSWIIDPIDGTTNYAHCFPVCCVSIAVLHRGTAILGGVYDPFRDELFLAEKGKGARLNGRRMRVSRIKKVDSSLLLTGFAYDRMERARYLLKFYQAFMERCHDVRRSGTAALDLAWTAAGRVDGYWEFNLNPWDVAAGRLLVEEAGGKVTDFRGRPPNRLGDWGKQTLASNGRIHRQMLRVLARFL